MGSILKKVARIAAPAALSIFAPGIGTAIGAGLGAGATFAPVVGNALLGAATGGLTGGGLKGALLGGVTGGVGGALSGAGGPNALTRTLGIGGNGSTTLSGLGIGGDAYNSAMSASGLAGKMTTPAVSGGGLANIFKGGIGGSGSGVGNISLGNVGDVLSSLNNINDTEDMEKKLKEAQGRVASVYQPYLDAGTTANTAYLRGLDSGAIGGQFTAEDFQADPGYQFRVEEGNKALERSLAARGMSSSGAALKAAQEYGQGLADQTYNDAFTRWLAQQGNTRSAYGDLAGRGLAAATGVAGAYDTVGDIAANSQAQRASILNQILSGSGNMGRQVIGYDLNGNPIYGEV